MRSSWSALVLAFVMVGCLEDIHDGNTLRRGRGDGSEYIGDDLSPSSPSSSSGSGLDFLVLGPTVRQADPPPPISGGHLAITPDNNTAVVADPDRDAVYVVDLSQSKTLSANAVRTVQLSKYDEPGRVAIDHEGRRAFVSLRGGGSVVAIDLATRTTAWRYGVCPMPRGIAWNKAKSSVIVVCVGGEIVTLPADGSSSVRVRSDVTDLRDVVVTSKGKILVTTFRSPKELLLDDQLNLVTPSSTVFRNFAGGPRTLAWKTMAVAAPDPAPGDPAPGAPEVDDDEIFMASQIAGEQIVEVPAQYYTPEPESATVGPVTVVSGPDYNVPVPGAVLPVDIAVSQTQIAVVSAANGHSDRLPTVLVFDRKVGIHGDQRPLRAGNYMSYPMAGQITSIAYTPDGTKLVGFSREPAQLIVYHENDYTPRRVSLSNTSREDTGHAIFHSNAGRGSACASCHAEGRDDGHSWESIELGPRRTPSLLGTVANTAPYHWNGEAKDMTALMRMTFTDRMRGRVLRADQSDALDAWIKKVPALVASAPRDPAAAQRGKAIFESSNAKCSTCHSGSILTNNATVNVGTFGAYQVPSLIGVSLRAPYLHDGSRSNLKALLEKPHGGAVLTTDQAADVAVFLGTL